ncbi:MAG: acetamidase [Chloroflexi bacterium RBG_13_51_18]|nr:MAG: acetamidase [Chloroflexi bacterium RBG_13_51_18]
MSLFLGLSYAQATEAKKIVIANEIVDVIGPSCKMIGPIQSGGIIIATPEAACFGPMITPHLKSGHTLTIPVSVEGAEVGDSVAIKIRRIKVLALATASGTEIAIEGRYIGEADIAARCPKCGTINPPTELKGTGPEAICCKICGTPCIPYRVTNGYTIIFDEDRSIGVTVPKATTEEIAKQAYEYSAVPRNGLSYPVTLLSLADLPPGIIARVRPMIGNIGTIPAVDMPSSHNAGDLTVFLVDAPFKLAIAKADEAKRTDAHMDIDNVREGAIIIAPVKVPGAGIVVGDVHAMQGDGEIAGHTTDVSAEVTLEVELIKGLNLDGPILLPNKEDLPFLARLYNDDQLRKAGVIADRLGFAIQKDLLPIQVIGSGSNLNEAVRCGVERMARLAGISPEAVKNWVTLTGGVEIGRLPGLVTVTMMVPIDKLKELGIAHLAQGQYLE